MEGASKYLYKIIYIIKYEEQLLVKCINKEKKDFFLKKSGKNNFIEKNEFCIYPQLSPYHI